MNTYIRFYRNVIDHPLLANDNNAYIVFTKLLTRVNWKDGTIITGRFKAAEFTNLKPTTVYATLKRLEEDKMITQEHNNRFTKITVVNWKKYQNDDSGYDNQMTSSRQPDDTINNNKRIKNKENTALLNQLIKIVNPKEKPTEERIRVLNGRLNDYKDFEIIEAAKAFSQSEWHKENKKMSIDNLLAPSKFGRWYNESQDTKPSFRGFA